MNIEPGVPQTPTQSTAASKLIQTLGTRVPAILKQIRQAPWTSSLFVAVLYIAFVVFFVDYSAVFEFDYDEGNNLIKAFLSDRGFRLYRDIWSDQPPVFNWILSIAHSLFGWRPAVARTVVLCFAGAIVFVTSDTVVMATKKFRKNNSITPGSLSGAITVLILASSNSFLTLSMSAMLGLPSIAFMMFALWAVTRYTQRPWVGWLAIAGVFAGLSMGSKMFTAFVVPVCGITLLFYGFTKHSNGIRWRSLNPAILFSVVFIATLLVIFVPYLSAHAAESLLETHRRVRASRHGSGDGFERMLVFFKDDAAMFLLAAFGAVRAILTKNGVMICWLLWFMAAVAGLYDHYPVWPHHRLLITIPGAALAGFGIDTLFRFRFIRNIPHWAITALWIAAVAATGIIVVHFSVAEDSDFQKKLKNAEKEAKIQRTMNSYAKDVQFIVTSRQLYAFNMRRPCPPDLAVTSLKRFMAKQLSAKKIIRGIDKYNAEMVVMSTRWRKSVRNEIRNWLRTDYQRVYHTPFKDTEIWILKKITR